jgi:hypothetical protein
MLTKGAPARSALSPNASVPNKISYQGLLTTTDGAPVVDGAYELKFELFNLSGGGGALWSETQPGIIVYKGTFSVLLGAVTPLTGIFYQPLWVEVTANSGPGIAAPILFTPRTELASAAYSLGPWYSENDSIWVTDSKNIGINTTSPMFPLAVSPFATATVAKFGFEKPIYLIQNNPHVGFNIYYQGGFRYGSSGIGGATVTYNQNVANALTFNNAPVGTADEAATLTTRMTIRDDGKIGIGTTTPDKLLEVAGSVQVGDTLSIGSDSQSGYLNLYNNGSALPIVKANNYAPYGGNLSIHDELGNTIVDLRPNGWGAGGGMRAYRNTSNVGFEAWGNWWGLGEGFAGVYGNNRQILFEPRFAGDASVQLPDSSISSAEILDEPGVAQQNTSSIINIPSTTMTDIDTISVTIPSSGYIVLEASGFAYLYGTTGPNQLYAQIDETTGGSLVSPNWTKVGLGSYATTAANFFQIFCTRTYYKTAGTYAFRFEASQVGGNGSGSSTNIYMTQLRAAYYSTSYGAVNASVPQAEAYQFESINLKTGLLDQSDENTSQSETFYNVDLRDLEIKAMKARVEADKAERELLEAQMKQQQATGSEPR